MLRCGSQNSPALPESRADLSVVVERHEPGAGRVVGVHAFVRFMDLGDVDAAILPVDKVLGRGVVPAVGARAGLAAAGAALQVRTRKDLRSAGARTKPGQ